MRPLFLILSSLIASIAIVACSAANTSELQTDDDGGSASSSQSGSATGTGGQDPGPGAGGSFNSSVGVGVGGTGNCDLSVDDFDKDGFTVADGDCNDCDANVNPGAIEVITDPNDPMAPVVDEDCDGDEDEAFVPCDDNLSFDAPDPDSAVKAIDLCTKASNMDRNYGVIEAYWAHADGSQASQAQLSQFGIQSTFGSNVSTQVGSNMLLLSSGFARMPGQEGAASDNSESPQNFMSSTAPQGFPQDVPGCDGGTEIYDDIALQLRLRAPTNATGFKYRFKFYSFEFAEYVCTEYNDQYIALVEPPPMGSINGNVSFDSNSNPVSVNIAFFDVCDPVANDDFASFCFGNCPQKPSPYCPLGAAELLGTGFDDAFGSQIEDAGATSWLETTVPVTGGQEFKIRFAIWDTGDTAYDSSVLIDGFTWVATPGTTIGTTNPPK